MEKSAKANKIMQKIISNIEFTPDCQNKWDFDGVILTISSRGYDRNQKSFYVGFDLILKQSEKYGYEEWVEILKDELIDDDFDSLKNKVKQWYKEHFVEALDITIKVLTGEYKLKSTGLGSYEIINGR